MTHLQFALKHPSTNKTATTAERSKEIKQEQYKLNC